ncbi:unnamed protein product [Rhizophagus irregularis]|nr:unnamed protein product [Rhizophagus irregularis]
MKFNLFFVLLSIFATIALTHPSAGSECKKPCCKERDDCLKPENSDCSVGVGVYCNVKKPCGGGCGT